MSEQTQVLETIRKKVRQRMLFSGFTLLLYGSFTLCYTDFGSFLSHSLGDSSVTGALVFFVALIVIFIAQEYLFLALNKEKK